MKIMEIMIKTMRRPWWHWRPSWTRARAGQVGKSPFEEASMAYGMQISAQKTQLMTNNTNDISTDITINNKKLETVCSFKHLGAIVYDEGSKTEVLSRTAQTTAAMTKLKVIWTDKNIAISSKIRLMRSLAMSIFLYTCETWTITAETERIQHWRWDVSANSSVTRTEIT